jgi:hypothetical protein
VALECERSGKSEEIVEALKRSTRNDGNNLMEPNGEMLRLFSPPP